MSRATTTTAATGSTINGSSGNANDNSNENQRSPLFQKVISIIVQMLVMHLVMYFLSSGKNRTAYHGGIGEKSNSILKNSFENGEVYDIFLFLSDNHSIDLEYLKENSSLINVREKELYVYKMLSQYDKFEYTFFADDSWKKEKYLTVALIPIYFYENRTYPLINSPLKEQYKNSVLIENIPLTKKMFPYESEEEDKYNLLSKETIKKTDDKMKKELYHIKKRIDINVVYDMAKHRLTDFNTPHLKTWKINLAANTFTPAIYLSDFWLLETDYILIEDNPGEKQSEQKWTNYICDDTLYLIKNIGENNFVIERNQVDKKVTITFNYGVCSFMYFMFTRQMGDSFLNMEEKTNFSLQNLTHTTTTKEINMIKKILLTTNIYMLIFSTVFILLHTILSFFAFKNDMQFWYQNESMEGLSALSVITSFVSELILALYLYDSEETSWVLLLEMFIGVALSAWKVTKAVHVSFSKQYPFLILKDKKNYTESMTKKYDKIAIKYVGIALFPCFIGYAVYSLFYYKYKSWYSYVISVLAGTVYTFGFVMMTPQLYINYKLKSVEHLPWRALIYKSLNTFVDDVAFFLIDMPWMHKLSCFRDDIIFLCYIYQRCIYKVDKNRNVAGDVITQQKPTENTNAQKGEGISAETTSSTQANTEDNKKND